MNRTRIETQSTSRGKRWELPRRPLPVVFRLIPIAVWALFIGLLAAFFLTRLGPALSKSDGVETWFELVFDGLPLLFGLFVLGIAGYWSTLAFWGRSIIETTRDKILISDRAGLFRTKRSIPIAEVKEISIVSGGETQNLPPFLQSLSGILLGKKKSGKFAAIGYPEEMVEHVALSLRNQLGLDVDVRRESGLAKSLDLENGTEAGQNPLTEEEILTQKFPPNLEVIDFNPDQSISFRISPKGFFKGSGGLGCFAAIWNAMLVVFGGFMLAGLFSSDSEMSWVMLLFLIPFVAAGVIIFRWARKLGTKTIEAAAGAESLTVDETWRGGSKNRTFSRGELAAIHVAGSGASVNNRELAEVKLVPKTGKPIGLFQGLEDEDLRWIAGVFRFFLKVPASPRMEEAELESFVPSVCQIEPASRRGRRIVIPKTGMFGAQGGLGLFSIIWMAFVLVFPLILYFFEGKFFSWALFPFHLVLGIFFIAGLAMLYFAVKRGSNEGLIEVWPDRLKMESKSKFDQRSWDLRKEEITAIEAAPSGERINNNAVHQLSVYLRDQPKIALFNQLPNDELSWLAALLRNTLELNEEEARN